MGPVCIFCLERCFREIPIGSTDEKLHAYRRRDIRLIATCVEGKKYEKERLGVNFDDVKNCLDAGTVSGT